ncbi:MAG: pilus (MSHA type) biogenesis protein MshL [Campylobacterota bacterium]
MKKTALLLSLIFTLSLSAKECEDRYFTLSTATDFEIRLIDLVQNISNECKISVVYEDKGVKEKLQEDAGMIHAQDFSLGELFELLFKENNIYHEYDPDKKLLRLAYIKTQTFHIDYVNFTMRKSSSTKRINIGPSSAGDDDGGDGENTRSSSDATSISYESDFAFWNNIEQEVRNILAQDSFEDNARIDTMLNRDSGSLTVSATSKQLERVEKYLHGVLSRMHKQIMIEAKIVEVSNSDIRSTGVDWSQLFEIGSGAINGNINLSNNAPTTSSFAYNYNVSLEKIVEFLDDYGDVEVVSNPKIMTLNNQPAIINVGEQLYYRYESGDVTMNNDSGSVVQEYTTDSLFVGVSLSVTPQVTDEGFVMLTVQPVISSLSDQGAGDDAEDRTLPPDTKIKQMSSMVKVKEGSKVIIGGLMENEDSIKRVGIPLLKDIPLFGALFGTDSKREVKKELVVVLTPKFVGTQSAPSVDEFEKIFEADQKDQ